MTRSPSCVGDFTGDGHLDLAVANLSSNTVSVLLGNGDGTFQAQVTYAVGSEPGFPGGGRLQRRRAKLTSPSTRGSNTVSVLLGNGDGTFQPQRPCQRRRRPHRGGGLQRRRTARSRCHQREVDDTVSVLLGNGDGTFQAPKTYDVGGGRRWRWATSTATASSTLPSPTRRLARCRCCWATATAPSRPQQTYAVGSGPDALAVGDFTDDGHARPRRRQLTDNTVSVLLGNGNGTFTNASTIANSVPNVPLLANFSNPMVPDALILSDDGTILYRQAIPAEPGTFAPPIPVNPASDPGPRFHPRRHQPGNAGRRPRSRRQHRSPSTPTTRQRHRQPSSLASTLSLPAGDQFPTLIMAANLTDNPDGQAHDLVVFSEDSGTVTDLPVQRRRRLPGPAVDLRRPRRLRPGHGAGQFGLDILVTNQDTGAVTELVNNGNGQFSRPAHQPVPRRPGAVRPGHDEQLRSRSRASSGPSA